MAPGGRRPQLKRTEPRTLGLTESAVVLLLLYCNNNKFMLSVCSCRDALGLWPREALAASLKESLKECMIMTGHKYTGLLKGRRFAASLRQAVFING